MLFGLTCESSPPSFVQPRISFQLGLLERGEYSDDAVAFVQERNAIGPIASLVDENPDIVCGQRSRTAIFFILHELTRHAGGGGE